MNDEIRIEVYKDYLNGFTEKEIAVRKGVSQSTVSRLIAKVSGMVEYRLSNLALHEFSEYFVKTKDAIERDIKEITEEIERETDNERKDKLRDQRHQRRLHLWQLIGDGPLVLYLRKLKQDGILKNPT